MILYLVRHAVAMEREDWDGSDEARPLTEEGIEKMKEAARGLVRTGLRAGRVFSSPLKRARQTADILVKELDLKKTELIESLAPGGAPPLVLKELAGLSDDERVMLVGHEPDLGHLAAFLLGADHPLPFKKGAVMAIEFGGRPGQSRGEMLWYMPTKIMRTLTAHSG
ncbi:MAG: phosphohistidine phosphatase SixA [Candidatus Lindowbacteria bacterium RIFCSPLOWO2_12_FULL_62_27]|nr:MAG: phosphohistidine phosphatase SixA [Candidatus Lindowbacteria bacterium RIFCSPLOWO2_02_FULL_62_12]OGH59982.1 MAG: phosphohistidine phosphatase SixA [Candidatus Lindowbacteria bacterium RIFCSPLOWO2_12_FULL_62_27]